MRNWIAGAMTVLGTLLVLGGAGTIILRTWWKPAPAPSEPPTPPAFGSLPAKPGRGLMRLDEPDRLIFWGIVLLVLAAVAAGAIGFNLGATATAR